jgi:heme a synthase
MWKNFIEGKSGVQFVHRYLAWFVVGSIGMIWYRSRKLTLNLLQKRAIDFLLVMVFIQFLLGIFTLLYAVPLWLGVAHQVGAFFLLAAMTFTLHRFTR